MATTLLGFLPNWLQRHVKEWLKEQLDHLKSYEARVVELEGAIEKLKDARVNVQHKVDEEVHRHEREIDEKVKEWLEGVENIISEYEDFHGDERHKCAVFDLFSSGYLPKPGIRHRLSAKAYNITKKVNGLLETAKHGTFSHWTGPPSMAAFFANVGYVSFPSRKGTMENIMTALEDPNVRLIGIHGLRGVGKTTLVKEVAKKVLEDKMFDVVVMANVTKKPDIRKIQGQIADMLGMKLEEESDIARAARIRKRLKNEKENTLIILDDLCSKLDFNMLGIPSENDDDNGQKNLKEGKSTEARSKKNTEKLKADSEKESTEAQGTENTERLKGDSSASNNMKTQDTFRGSEVLLISESKPVLLSQMDGKGNSIFSVKVLKDKEAEMLFKKMAGIDDKKSELDKLAAQIASKCNGLPISIVTTAKALKNQSRSEWEDVNRKLERQKLTGAPEFSTKLCYDLLEDEELKYTFLLCARMAQDALIMDLVKYCIGLGFLQGIYTVREAKDRVYGLVAKLKESSLLSDSYSSDRFTMQDIVRSAALSIASKERHVYSMTKEKLDEWPDEDKLRRYGAISLQHCNIIDKFPKTINCPRLRVFHVDNSDPRLKIPDDFFRGMKELRVLILTGINLSPLPWSISCLTKLRMLCLEQCMLGEKLSIIGELKQLRILSFSGSDIKELPAQLQQLAKLQIFDISNCSKLAVIPLNLISSLTSLEQLYMRNSLIQWNVEEKGNQGEIASLSELRHLYRLITLDMQIPNVAPLPENLFFDKLYSYNIVIGDLSAYSERDFRMPEKYEASRFLALQLKDDSDIHSQRGIKMLFESVEIFWLGELNGVQDIFGELNMKGFPYLKHLSIVSNSHIKYIINTEDWQLPEKAFYKLESMYLFKLNNMKQICNANVQIDDQLKLQCFRRLKVIKIKMCSKLENVFLFSMVGFLTSLETIEVSECDLLKEIVAGKMQSNIDKIQFPELHSLTLESLYEFVAFYTICSSTEDPVPMPTELFPDKLDVPNLQRVQLSSMKIKNIWCDQPLSSPYFDKLTHLDVNDCGNLKYLLSFSMAKRLGNLQSLFLSECGKMENIIKPEEKVSKDSIFPKLKNIKLSYMKGLKKIWHSDDPLDSFGKLDTLIIEKCDKLKNVFPCYMVGRFQSLCHSRVTNCKSMEVIFVVNDDGKQLAGDANSLQVRLEALPKLEHVWKRNKEAKGSLNLQKLQRIWVQECPRLENIFPFSSVAKGLNNLEQLVAWDCRQLKEIFAKRTGANTNISSPIQFVFPKLTTVKFSKLPKLKSFYPGTHGLSCPALNNLFVEQCDQLEPFRKEDADEQTKPVFPKKVIYKLKSMQIEPQNAEPFTANNKRKYRMDYLEELQLSRLENTEILFGFLHRYPNLKGLWLNDCSFKELVPHGSHREKENLGVVPKLKSLKLTDLDRLVEIGFERDTVLQRIESLILKKCSLLTSIVPYSVSFTHLTNLEVVNCEKLTNLMVPSSAKSLVQLTTMKVIKCESLEEIVSKQQNEENAGKKIDIVFKQLKALELVNLEKLTSFCSSKSCTFELPSLEKLVVSGCPSMEKFSEKVESTPILRKIYVGYGKKDHNWYWEGGLNTTIEKMFKNKNCFEGVEELVVSQHIELQFFQVLNGRGQQDNYFYCLKTLKLIGCKLGSHAIPSTVFPCLKSLKELEIWNCINVKVIFAIFEIKGTAFQLRKLVLCALGNLTQVWDKDCQGIYLNFQNLQEVLVNNCDNLKTLFPSALAKKLKKLEKLDISYCRNLDEIVGKEEAAAATEEFEFPRLMSLDLSELPRQKGFTLECPVLNRLDVSSFDELQLFGSRNEEDQPFLLHLTVLSNLEDLALNWKNTNTLLFRFKQWKEELQCLNQLSLCFDDDDEKKESSLPFEILKRAPNLENLEVSYFSGQRDISLVNPAVSFSNLKTLTIRECHGLKYIFTSSTAQKLKHLEEMHIQSCDSMEEIVEKEQNEREKIKFERLERIVLEYLSRVECFYSGNATLQLPSLTKLVICQCPMMQKFLSRIDTSGIPWRNSVLLEDDASVLHNDLDSNSTVEMVFRQQEQIDEVSYNGDLNTASKRQYGEGSSLS